jgi:hypothetical protein
MTRVTIRFDYFHSPIDAIYRDSSRAMQGDWTSGPNTIIDSSDLLALNIFFLYGTEPIVSAV